jgi:diguanylate cyclase (GGDEF)-like protein
MPSRAWSFVLSIIVTGIALSVWAFTRPAPLASEWVLFAMLTGLALLSEVYRSNGPHNMSHSVTSIFEFVGLLLLPPALFVMLVAIPLLFDWARARVTNSSRLRQWYKQPFNISMTLVAGFAALAWPSAFFGTSLDPSVYAMPMIALIVGAAFTVGTMNHLLLRLVVTLAQGRPLREVARVDSGVVLTDCFLLLLGYIVAILWTLNPPLALLTIAPLFLIYRALRVPHLEQEAHVDGKTGLLNARAFMQRATAEWERAQRYNQPLAVLMADLDLLRDINNSYGHLAGDAVLTGVGEIIRTLVRNLDVAGRFGGEEFAIVLPNVDPAEAEQIAARLCHAVEAAEFSTETSPTPVKATMSIGVATFPEDASSLQELLHEADVAVFRAKMEGRNRVMCSPDVPKSFRLESRESPPEGRVLAS